MTGGEISPELQAIADRQGDQPFMDRLYSGDGQAKLEWDELFKRAHPEPAEAPSYVDADGVRRPVPQYYPLHDVPADVAPSFRAAAAVMRLTDEEADDLARACLRGEEVCSVLDDAGDQSLVDDALQRVGTDGIAAARRAFAMLKLASPDLARRLEATGSANHRDVVGTLARIGARLSR